MARFLGATRLGRTVIRIFHRWPIHPGLRSPLIFAWDAAGACIFCRVMTRSFERLLPSFEDQSSIKISEPEYDADGKLIKRGVTMTATAKRQLEEIFADDPELAALVQKQIESVAKDA